jgi:uncharacterized protein YfaS (alpha-2-macroglobulin family)
VLDGGLGYLEQKVKEREMSEWFYFENNVLKSRKVPRQEIFYSLYVLALADRPSVSAMNFYKSQVNLLAPESKYLLASSYLLSGDRKSYQMLLPKAFGNEKAEGVTGGYYGSYIRDVSVALNALLEADPNHPQVAVLMKEVSEEMEKPGRFPSTQEDAFALLAMGKFMRRALQADISASVTLDGKPVATFKNENLKVANDISDKTVAITSRGSGMLYYSYEVSGIPRSEKQGTEDNFLRVRKRYLDRNGNEFNASGFRQNDLVVVEISAEASYRKTIQNVAITDLLPACFEIENSRLVAEREMKWMNQAHPADYVDIRDDRISFFTTLSERTSYFYYTCRVVSRGAFTAGPVSADAMYNGDYHSWSGSGIVRVE